ncbi:MFS transporter [Streptosporangium sp. NPDC051022]|uniref:MFS transporter n=1 Tax=Streptosporangium sp. NPDC051022 TaxID=3155752 RepID=UPI00341B2E3F
MERGKVGVSHGEAVSGRRSLPWAVQVLAPAVGLSNFGDSLAVTALLLDFHDRYADGTATAAVFLALSVPSVILVGFAGRVADRLPVRRVLIPAGVALMSICTAMAYLTSAVLIVVLLAALAGIMAFATPVMMKAVADASPADLLSRSQARMAMMANLGFLIGPAAGGVLMEAAGLRTVLLVDAASFAALPLAALLLRAGRDGTEGTRPIGSHGSSSCDSSSCGSSVSGGARAGSGLLPGLRAMAAAPGLLRVVGFGVVLTVALQVVNVVEVFFVRDDLGAGAGMFGVLMVGWSSGQVSGAWTAGRLPARWNPASVASVATFVMAVVMTSVAAVGDVRTLFALLVLNGFAYGAFGVARQTLLAGSVDTAVRGSVFAAHVALLNVASTAALLAGGVMSAFVAPRAVFGLVGAAMLLSVLVSRPWRRSAPLHRPPYRRPDDHGRGGRLGRPRRW